MLRWGILGTAHVNRRLIPAMRAAGRSTLHAVASRDDVHGRAYAAEWEIPIAVAGYDALLARDDIDAIYVPLPNALHAEWTLAAIAAGKHVLCEKPLALNAADVDRVATAAKASAVVVEEGVMYRHEPLTERVAALVHDGAVGAVRAIVSGFTYAQTRPRDVRLDPVLGGGALWDVGGYPVSYACNLMRREPTMVFGSAQWSATGVDEEFTGLMRFAGGTTATIYAGFRAAYHTWLGILGSEGSLQVPNPFKPGPLETLTLERLGETQHFAVAGSPLLFLRQVEHFVARVLDGAPATIPLGESRRSVSTLVALYRSAGRPRG